MANQVINNQSFLIFGDNVATTASIVLGCTLLSSPLVSSVITATGVDVSSNVLSVVPSGNTITITFVAAFAGFITLTLNITASAASDGA